MTGGPINGGSVITLGGFGFTNFDQTSSALGKARCRWGSNDTTLGSNDVIPTALVTEYIVCPTTPKAEAGAVMLSVATNGLDFVETSREFIYYAVSITSVEPQVADDRGVGDH